MIYQDCLYLVNFIFEQIIFTLIISIYCYFHNSTQIDYSKFYIFHFRSHVFDIDDECNDEWPLRYFNSPYKEA